MGVRTVGIEEELMLVDPATREMAARSPEVLEQHETQTGEATDRGPGQDGDELDHELFMHQVEIRTEPARQLSSIRAQLVDARRAAGEAAAATGTGLIAAGTAPLGGEDPRTTRTDRYRRMVQTFGEVARSGSTCGMHVHVGIDSPEEGVRVIDRIAPWLPVILALSSNSPIAFGRDTGYASWRFQMWSRWPSAGPTEPFGSLAEYHRVAQRLLDSGAASDPGMLYFDARLAQDQPTVEVRVADVTDDPGSAVVIAALVRALVERSATDQAAASPGWRVEFLRAAQWRASRFGCTDTLLDPVDHRVRPARVVVERMVEWLHPTLAEAEDLDLTETGVARLLRRSGASLQRKVLEREGSVEAVVDDLIRRTALSWA